MRSSARAVPSTLDCVLIARVEKVFKEILIHEAEPELLAEPLGGTETAAVSVAADAQAKQDAASTGVEVDTQGSVGQAQVRKRCTGTRQRGAANRELTAWLCIIALQGADSRRAVTGVFTSLRRSFLKRGSESSGREDATRTTGGSEDASTPAPRE